MERFILFLLIALTLVCAQDNQAPNPRAFLDRPLDDAGFYEFKSEKLMKVTLYDNGYQSMYTGGSYNGSDYNQDQNVYNLLNDLYRKSTMTGTGGWYWNTGWTQWRHSNGSYDSWNKLQSDVNKFRDDLRYFLGNFSQSSEVMTMSLKSGDNGYVDEFGTNASNEPEDYYDYYNDSKNTVNLEFYVGRNTAIGGAGWDDGIDACNYQQVRNHPNTIRRKQMSLELNGTTYDIWNYGARTPLVLDMDGDGELQASNGQWLRHQPSKALFLRSFDMTGNGFDELVEWVGPKDGLLVVYKGQQVTGADLFGDADGFVDGYHKLSTLDKNADMKLTGDELSTLSVWQDSNRDAKTQADEVTSVKELGITEIGLTHKNYVSHFVHNGVKKAVWDWYPVTYMVKKRK